MPSIRFVFVVTINEMICSIGLCDQVLILLSKFSVYLCTYNLDLTKNNFIFNFSITTVTLDDIGLEQTVTTAAAKWNHFEYFNDLTIK